MQIISLVYLLRIGDSTSVALLTPKLGKYVGQLRDQRSKLMLMYECMYACVAVEV